MIIRHQPHFTTFRNRFAMEARSGRGLNALSCYLSLRRSKKKTCLASGLCGKKERGGAFFFLFSFKMATGHIFQNNRPAYFFKMAASYFVLMGPTWTQDMTSVYLGLDLEKDRIFLCFFNSKKKKKSRRPQKRKRAGTLNMFFFYFALYWSILIQMGKKYSQSKFRGGGGLLRPHLDWSTTAFQFSFNIQAPLRKDVQLIKFVTLLF